MCCGSSWIVEFVCTDGSHLFVPVLLIG